MLRLKPILECQIFILLLTLVTGVPGLTQAASQSELEAPPAAASRTLSPDGSLETSAMKEDGTEDQEELLALLSVLEEETEVATKSKMNNDYVPGMVTVLHGDHLEALGIRTVAEALSLVPGIQLSRIHSGEPSLKVRGIAYPFNAGNVKVMLNSISLSRESSGINSSVLLVPVEQIDRIEVIRGPGSSIYGDFAMTGVVNIITRNTGGRLFGFAGDDGSAGGGGHYSYRDPQSSFGLGLNISHIDGGNSATAVTKDPDEERQLAVFDLQYKGFSLVAEGVFRDLKFTEPARSLPGAPPGASTGLREGSSKEQSWAIEGRQLFEPSQNISAEANLSYLRNVYDMELPTKEFHGDRVEAKLDIRWKGWAKHQPVLGLSYTDSDIDDAFQQGAPREQSIEASGIARRSYSLTIQDQIELNDRLSVTLGARFDDYDDVGSLLSPRLACVYRLAERHVLKAQYSEGFRAPTFWELYTTGTVNENLDFEVIETTEFSYIYRRPKSVGRLTLYHSEIDDGIFRTASDGSFGNSVEMRSNGVEVEWEQKLGDRFRWLANVSYVDARDERSGETADYESLGVADWLGNIAFFMQLAPRLMVTTRLLHVGDRHSSDGWIDGYDTVDFTVSRMDLITKGLTLRAGVKNVFDDDIVYVTAQASQSNLIEDEFQGRTWWLQITYDF